MFFESVETEEVPSPRITPALPPWMGPPFTERGTILLTDRLLGRSGNVVLHLPLIRAYKTGCAFEVELTVRQGDLPAGDFLDLMMTHMYNAPHFRMRAGEPLPDRLLRWGVRYRDGTKLTTIDRREPGSTEPMLYAMASGDGLRTGSLSSGIRLWLWPLPPQEPFELAVEWPMGGIELSITEIDGAAIAAASERSTDYWP
ncbi:hypothetical protein AB0I81_10780 [Nonomuraea sp. NPDC050404]|uniref:hypothetical protein n=1 Tax=Nonomuraea sp. NPDC050404 TaxID=3155783 RepID=UPI0033DB5490